MTSSPVSASTERVPIETVRCGDPIKDLDGGGEFYRVLEAKAVDGGGVVLELEHTQWRAPSDRKVIPGRLRGRQAAA